ncbi:MAG: DinB family protein [Thermoflexales bacterium]
MSNILTEMYARNMALVKGFAENLTHAQSLIQPPAGWNCMNWIVGHIACYRNRILGILEMPLTLDPAIAGRYPRDSAPVRGDEPGIGRLADLVAAIEASQARIEVGLAALPGARADEVITLGSFTMSRADFMVFYMRHEAYHTGQLEFLSALARA